jgi:heme exporter protein D
VLERGKMPAWTTIGPLGRVMLVLCAAAALWYVTATYAGEILRDHRRAGTWQTAYDLRAVDGSCRRIQLVITFCSAKIMSLAEPERAPVVSEFMMGFSGGGGEAMVPVRSTVDPSAVAIAFAAETKLANRTLTWLVSAATLAALLICAVNALLQGRYKDGPAHRSLLNGLAELQARAAATQAAPNAAP